MTVSSTTTSVSYAGNGSTTAFAVTFPFFEITAYLTTAGIESELTSGTHYTLSGGSGATGALTMVTAPASGTTLRIKRTTARTQLVDYSEGDGFPAETHEKVLDRAYMIIQELEATLVDDVLNFNEIGDSDDLTQGASNLFLTAAERAKIAGFDMSEAGLFSIINGLTEIDGASWAQANGMRIGANLNVAGSGVGGSANEFGLLIHTNTTGATSGTAAYEKAGLLVIAQTSDPSTSYDRDTVGIDMRGYIAADNALGRAWGGYSEARILTGGDGLLYAHEFFVVNNGVNQPLANTTTSKYAAHFVATGTNHATAAQVFTGVSGTAFNTGLYFNASAIVTHALYCPSVFSLRINGSMGFGTDSPDRLVHAEVADSGTNTVVHAARFSHVTSGTAAVGLGVGMEFELESAGGTNRVAGDAAVEWLDATDAAEYAQFRLRLMNNGSLTTTATIDAFGVITAFGAFNVGANQVVGARDTGWTAMTGTPNESATYDVASVTLPQLAARVAAIQAALTTHGLIGA